MSSLRNSLHRRNHKERSQLSHRSRLGLLEKHKDYVLRAKDYHSKQDRITRLKQKAAERNKDEFYFGMVKQRTEGGVHVKDRGDSSLPVDIVKVLKTQDENYIRTVRAAGMKKIEKLKSQLTMLADLFSPGSFDRGENGEDELDEEELEILKKANIISSRKTPGRKTQRARGHIIFVDDEQEAQKYSSLQHRKRADDETQKEASKSSIKHRVRLLKELSARLARDTQLRYAERELEMQRLLMGKGGKKKLMGPVKVSGKDDGEDDDDDEIGPREASKAVDEKVYKPRMYKWRTERKR